ncbi:hypothetical protein QFZ81_003880 [Paenibacillus sp. V4I9]|uniref:hypothetical protein n=1 Tax=Paenibacillus sp. V4I9 TaxID=3042308 RepID=UPI0027886959|nr:hypothetical protein [Paenibacillus sp. V4I9]MDQ0888792.1 hypothetical protein [Paenibacillus sp. V4I9]
MNLYEQGDELFANGYYQEAYEKFELAYRNGEENEADCLNYMACCQIQLDKALKISPLWERLLLIKVVPT